MKISIDAMSELGTRENQQDSYLYRSEEGLTIAVVCDGMGGMSGGDIASRQTVQRFKEDVMARSSIENIPEFLEQEVKILDMQVHNLKDEDGRGIRAGTTIVSVIIRENQMYWLTVGDSEIFVIRGEEIVAVNRKHNYQLQLDEMLSYRKITGKVYEVECKRGVQLISYLGMGNASVWDINQKPLFLQEGDYICLCSDGVTNTIGREEMLKIIRQTSSVEEAVKVMQYRIRRKEGSQDNATAILMKYHS